MLPKSLLRPCIFPRAALRWLPCPHPELQPWAHLTSLVLFVRTLIPADIEPANLPRFLARSLALNAVLLLAGSSQHLAVLAQPTAGFATTRPASPPPASKGGERTLQGVNGLWWYMYTHDGWVGCCTPCIRFSSLNLSYMLEYRLFIAPALTHQTHPNQPNRI